MRLLELAVVVLAALAWPVVRATVGLIRWIYKTPAR